MNSGILINGDSMIELDNLEENSIGSIVSDPPYLIDFMNKSWDTADNIAGSPDFWKKCFRALKPGGYAAVFGHSRTHHHIMNALEGAGFELKDTLTWLYGQGFPKSHNISKAIDKKLGADRKVIGKGKHTNIHSFGKPHTYSGTDTKPDITTAGSDEAEKWEGYGTALKPAVEFIVLAQKPREGTYANNCMKHGVGGLNINDCRIGYNGEVPNVGGRAKHGRGDGYGYKAMGDAIEPNTEGRFPANLVLSHSEGCVKVGDNQPIYVPNNKNKVWGKGMGGGAWDETKGRFPANLVLSHSDGCVKVGEADDSFAVNDKDKGSFETPSSMLFMNKNFKHKEATIIRDVYDCVDDCPVRLLDEQAPKTGSLYKAKRKKDTSGGSGDSWTNGGNKKGEDNGLYDGLGGASRFFYCAKVSRKERNNGIENDHPTLKPVALMRWLVKLITPPKETVLDPFMGAGSTGGACVLEGRDFYGIEMDERYFKIACARIEAWKEEKENEV